MGKTIKVIKNSDNPETIELLAESIIQVSEGFKKVLNSNLEQRAIIVLLQDYIGTSKITKHQIRLVLDNLPRLRSWYVKK